MNSSISLSPFFTQSHSIEATVFFSQLLYFKIHRALIYFSPFHNAAQVVGCVNKERRPYFQLSLIQYFCPEKIILMMRDRFYTEPNIADGS